MRKPLGMLCFNYIYSYVIYCILERLFVLSKDIMRLNIYVYERKKASK